MNNPTTLHFTARDLGDVYAIEIEAHEGEVPTLDALINGIAIVALDNAREHNLDPADVVTSILTEVERILHHATADTARISGPLDPTLMDLNPGTDTTP